MNLQRAKEILKKAWHFIWHEDSVASWIVNIVLAFIIVKYVVYPGLGFLLGTGFPIVAVVSGSMEHGPGFNDWWQQASCKSLAGAYSQGEWYLAHNITKEQFSSFSFTNGFNKGDVMILRSAKQVGIGEVLVFRANTPFDPIIHRVVAQDTVFKTKGDHNCDSGAFEQVIIPEQVLGKAVIRIPWIGWVKIGFVNLLKFVGL